MNFQYNTNVCKQTLNFTMHKQFISIKQKQTKPYKPHMNSYIKGYSRNGISTHVFRKFVLSMFY